MKRLLFFGMLLLCSAAWAQTADSVAWGRALGDEPQERRSRERNVLGAPVYYDTLGNVIGQPAPADSFYRRPKHHFRNRLEDDFSAFFLEGQLMMGSNDMALGGQVAYVPQRWGAYVGGAMGFMGAYVKAGPVWRLSDCGNDIDWQLFAGVNICRHLGAEIGLRMGAPRMWGNFCWTSYSMSVGYANRMSYITLGFSLSLTAIMALTIW